MQRALTPWIDSSNLSWRTMKSVDWFYITDRGWAVSIAETCEDLGIYDPDIFSGTEVWIDDSPYQVTGVETFCIARSPEHPYRGNFALLVEGERK